MNEDLWGKPVEETVQLYDSLELCHGSPACAECGSLLCLGKRGQGVGNPVAGKIGAKMLPHPAEDIDAIQCAGCGRLLWERGDE